jgi:hypothetical protein
MLKKRLINIQHVVRRNSPPVYFMNAPYMCATILAFYQAIIRHVDTKIICISVCPPLDDFCIDMPDDGLMEGQNLQRTCKAHLK